MTAQIKMHDVAVLLQDVRTKRFGRIAGMNAAIEEENWREEQ